VSLETEQPTPLLSKRIYDERSEEQAHSDANRDLHDRESDVERNGVEVGASDVGGTQRSGVTGRVPDNLIGGGETRYE
jgi:hypothetical protein